MKAIINEIIQYNGIKIKTVSWNYSCIDCIFYEKYCGCLKNKKDFLFIKNCRPKDFELLKFIKYNV